MKSPWILAIALLALLPGSSRSQDFICPTGNCAGILRQMEAEQERYMARLVRAEPAPGIRQKILRLGEQACQAARGSLREGRLRRSDEEYRVVSTLEFSDRSLTVVRLSGRDCSRLDVYLSAERPRWHHLSRERYSFYVPADGDILVERDDYAVFLEESAFWAGVDLAPARR